MKLAALLVASILVGAVAAFTIMPAKLIVIDGDTFLVGKNRIRIADIDAPEIHGVTACERDLAQHAKSRLKRILAEGPYDLLPVERDRDRYGRLLRVVARNGHSIGETLVEEGLAHVWEPGVYRTWC